jgi:hypothetical protein
MSCCGVRIGLADDTTIPDDLKATMGRAPVVRHCDVCVLLDGDKTPKPVQYCRLCDAFMCDPCRKNKWRRAGAAVARKIHRLRFINKGVSNGGVGNLP